MAEHTYEQLKGMTVAQLREIADGIQHEALAGHSTMHKEQLLPALCKALNIPIHHAAAGSEKDRLKALMRKLKADRQQARAKKDHAQAAGLQRAIHVLEHKLRHLAAQKK